MAPEFWENIYSQKKPGEVSWYKDDQPAKRKCPRCVGAHVQRHFSRLHAGLKKIKIVHSCNHRRLLSNRLSKVAQSHGGHLKG